EAAMNKAVFRGLLSDFKRRISGPLAEELKRHRDWLAKMPTPVFRYFVSAQWAIAIKYVRQSCSKDFPGEFALAFLVAELNESLSLRYPYIVTLVDFKESPGMVFVSAIERRTIPGIHDCLRQRYVPICTSENSEEFLASKIQRVCEFDFKEALRTYLQKASA